MLLEKLQKQRKLQPHKRRQQWQQQLKLQRRQHRKQLQLQVFQKSFHHRHQNQHNQQLRNPNQHQLLRQQQLRSPNQHQLNKLPLRSKMWLSQLHRQQRVHGQLLQHNKSLLWINQNHQMLNFIHLEDHQV